MLTTTVFTAGFPFVVWTFSSLYERAVKSLHVPLSRLRSGLPTALPVKGSPNLTRSTNTPDYTPIC